MVYFFLDKISFYFLIDAGLLLNRNIRKLNLDIKLVKTVLKGRHMFTCQCAENKTA